MTRKWDSSGFTCIDDPYEEPLALELVLSAAEKTPAILAGEIISYSVYR